MFIHWGLYSILEGEYKNNTNHAEWIRTTAQVPLAEYDQLLSQFNPTKFNADEWSSLAKEAGMKYVVITTKHHDGFALYDSKVSDFDVMATPFKRDIMAELSQSVRKNGLKMGWYHSIMDWHHPDYLPRRDWETNRSTIGADFNKYNNFLNSQVTELLTNYGDISVMWFDGEWESTWNHERGSKLYNLCRQLQNNALVNNRVDVGRGGMAGMSAAGYKGDFGTPEQTIPETGIPNVAWESCITMNNNWGWNKADSNWKSTPDLVAMLVDIVSKGGNLLLNIGPKPDGTFPKEAIVRLKEIGSWMRVNGDAIYGTSASPFKSISGAKATVKGNKLFLFVTDIEKSNKIALSGLATQILSAKVLGEDGPVAYAQAGMDATISAFPDKTKVMPVIEVTLAGPAVIVNEPEFLADSDKFYRTPFHVKIPTLDGLEIRYTTDGSNVTSKSELFQNDVQLFNTSTIRAAYFKDGKIISKISSKKFTKVELMPSVKLPASRPGLKMQEFQGEWKSIPDFKALTPIASQITKNLDINNLSRPEQVGRRYSGYINIPQPGLYTFELSSDDGSRLVIANQIVVDHDGLHNATPKTGTIGLELGLHMFQLDWFNATGGKELTLLRKLELSNFQKIPENDFTHRN